jgi:uncharacterized membrane protein YfcA
VSALDVAAALAVFAGSALQSATGFGFALVCAPLVFAAAGPQQAVGLLTVVGFEVNLLTLLGEGRRPQPLRRTVAIVLVCALPGMLAGVAVLRSVDAVVLQVALTVAVFASLAVQLGIVRRRDAAGAAVPAMRPAPRWALPAAGLASGAFATTTSTSGPPLVLVMLGRGLSPVQVRDTLMASFLGLGVLGAAVLAATGTRGALPHLAWLAALVPLAAAGQIAGRPLFRRLAGERYEAALTGVLTVSAIVGLLSAVL